MSEPLTDVLARTHVLIVTHVYATGPAQDLEEYLRDHVASLVFIGHPFPYAKDKRSFWRRFERGTLVRSGTFPVPRGPAVLFYIKDVLLTFFWAWRRGPHYDLAVCTDGLNTWCGLVLRFFLKTDRVVFYTIDWTPQRFSNRALNALYHLLDRIGVTHADRTWNLSSRMAEARAQRGVPLTARQRTVPIGVFLTRFPPPVQRPAGLRRVAFMGHLREGQGLSMLFRAFGRVAAQRSGVEFVIVGGGPLEAGLRAYAQQAGFSERVRFSGFLSDPRDVERTLQHCDLAVAPYEPGSFTMYTDPGKPKVYLACGLPILITDVPAVAGEIARAGAGLVVRYDAAALTDAMRALLDDPRRLAEMRERAYQLARSFDWEDIFSQSLKDVLRGAVGS